MQYIAEKAGRKLFAQHTAQFDTVDPHYEVRRRHNSQSPSSAPLAPRQLRQSYLQTAEVI